MNFPNVITTNCLPTTAPPPDPRCADPAFAIAFPDICGPQQTLLVKPAQVLTCLLRSLQMECYLEQAGTETLLTSGVTWSCSDTTIAVIGVASGNLTAIAEGDVTITATYQGITASASVTVPGGGNCCANLEVDTMIVMDVSLSMSLAFNSAYGSTRLDYAKEMAFLYNTQVNIQNGNKTGLITFDTTPTTQAALTTNVFPINQIITGLMTTPNYTGIGLALQAAILELSASSSPVKVILLISDGEDKDPNAANAPIPIADAFKQSGGVIISVGIRASVTDGGFDLLNGLATGGFFVNGTPDTATTTGDLVAGLKGYVCAGNCNPPGDVIANQGALDYNAFLNWNVVGGSVGVNLLGNGFFDLLPGNGLYVELPDAITTHSSFSGVLVGLNSKNTFNFSANKSYRLTFYAAGDQGNFVTPPTPPILLIQIGTLSGPVNDGAILNQSLSVPPTQGFTLYSYNFTPTADVTGSISFVSNVPGGSGVLIEDGIIIDDIMLQDVTDGTTLFSDNFDSENPVYVPPACGPSKLYPYYGHYGYNCYGEGCLSTPPPVQVADVNPLPDIETSGYVNPTTYNASASVTLYCPGGATSSSPNSLQNNPTSLVPVMTSPTSPSGTVTVGRPANEVIGYEGWRCFGTGPEWNPMVMVGQNNSITYEFPSPQLITAFAVTTSTMNTQGVEFVLEGSNDGINFTLVNDITLASAYATRMLFPTLFPASFTYYRLTLILASTATPWPVVLLEYFTVSASNSGMTGTGTGTGSSQILAQNAANQAAQSDAITRLNYAGCTAVYSSNQTVTGIPCPNGGTQTGSASATAYGSQANADRAATAQATATALTQCGGSNNTQGLVPAAAPIGGSWLENPYPSQLSYNGPLTVISNVTVSINGLYTHKTPAPNYFLELALFLSSPSGKLIVLMANVGGAQSYPEASPLNLVFSDAASGYLPQNSTIISGTYKSSYYVDPGSGLPNAAPIPPAPNGGVIQPLSNTLLSTFSGDNPQGAWALWAVNLSNLDACWIASWSLNIT